ncbi:MAG: phosphatidylserine decarboxylase family protein [Chitinophagales bacterium]|nr:phosphatidylserine decarboxylase family protein [Chitinophagales bacterium]
MTIHKEGYRILAGFAIALASINALLWYLMPVGQDWLSIFTLATIGFFLFVVYFFRKPWRKNLVEHESVISPADGKIVAIEEVNETEYFHEKRLLVSIFMSPSNVHINWNPISGTVKYVKYHPGKYLMAFHPKSSLHNERNTMVIENEGVEILVRQIAGILARRIVHYVNEGERVMQGTEFGFIKFGSRIDLFLPLDAEVTVQLKQKVKGGSTVIAKIK